MVIGQISKPKALEEFSSCNYENGPNSNNEKKDGSTFIPGNRATIDLKSRQTYYSQQELKAAIEERMTEENIENAAKQYAGFLLSL